MKNIIILLLIGLLTRQMQAQGTLYLSNLSQPPGPNNPVSTITSNRWIGVGFVTGSNDGGYLLNSIQIAMLNGSSTASGFSDAIYDGLGAGNSGPNPGNLLASLDGSSNPSTAGVYTYTPSSDFLLLPQTVYFMVFSASESYYRLSYTDSNISDTMDSWYFVGIGYSLNNGISWSGPGGIYGQFAISATPVPEPLSAWLLWLGGGVLFYVRKRKHHSA